ncbi:hypothetical protein [Qipengyuania atrilutea]|uniref:CHASE2 domain-containing protein n=1 Tax=Qipengyuania atrilutea TaxID=2744473 RepID=A0A850GY00_9SPHN|nr:hypothetical protein [Actirhodobacter atriluteus]NVD44451.1 hypothetical protein [Actirhodobacter atriluteus]
MAPSKILDAVKGDRDARWAFLIALGIAAIVALLNYASFLTASDGLLLDAGNRASEPTAPKVVVVDPGTQDPAGNFELLERLAETARNLGAVRIGLYSANAPGALPESPSVPLTFGLAELGRVPSADDRIDYAAARIAAADHGISRRQTPSFASANGAIPSFETALAGRLAAKDYFVRMPREQNIPVVSLAQVLANDFHADDFEGMVMIVAPGRDLTEAHLSTPLSKDGARTPASLFSAYAVQSLLDRSEIYAATPWTAFAAILALTLAVAAAMTAFEPKRALAPVLFLGVLSALLAAYLALSFANLLLPITAMIVAIIMAAVGLLLFSEVRQDRRLAAILERAIAMAFGNSPYDAQTEPGRHLTEAAERIGLHHSLVLSVPHSGPASVLGAFRADQDDMPSERTLRLIAADRKDSATSIERPTDWNGEVHSALLSSDDPALVWLYSAPAEGKAPHPAEHAHNIAAAIRQTHEWRNDLSTGARRARRKRPIDAQLASAASLITARSDRIAAGLDGLETAAMIFHLGGFPVHANAQMEALARQAGLTPHGTNLLKTLTALSDFSADHLSELLSAIIRDGVEIRIPAKDFGGLQRILRVAPMLKGTHDIIILEAVDITEQNRLAQQRSAVGNFVDKQLRNDLEVIELGAEIGQASAGEGSHVKEIFFNLSETVQRAIGRLEEVADFLNDTGTSAANVCYPLDARKVVDEALEKVAPFAAEFDVSIETALPGISGFTMAEPKSLLATCEAMLRIVIADTPHGGRVKARLTEELDGTVIEVSGGFGIPFERLMAALDSRSEEVPEEYRALASGFKDVARWQGLSSYWSAVGQGLRFNVKMRRIG